MCCQASQAELWSKELVKEKVFIRVSQPGVHAVQRVRQLCLKVPRVEWVLFHFYAVLL
jgi:hypothetical protein